MILHARSALGRARRVDRPRADCVDRAAHVLRAQPACEHDAPRRLAGALEMRRVGREPGQVDDRADLLATTEQHGVAGAVAVLTCVLLHEVGVGLLGLADEHGDAQHRRRRREQRRGAARALLGEDEPDEVGAGVDGCVDVLLAREPADLHERPCQQVAELRAGVARGHERRADEHRVGAGELGGGRLCPRRDPAFRDHDPITRCACDELELGAAIDREVAEVARVDADDRCAELDRALELVRVVRLDERVEPQRGRLGEELRARRVVQVAEDEQHRVGAGLARLREGARGSRRSPSRAAAALLPRGLHGDRPTSRRSARRRAPTSRVRPPTRRRARPLPDRRPVAGRRRRASGA